MAAIGDRLGRLTQSAKQKAQELSEVTTRGQEIRNIEKQLLQRYTDLGRAYYAAHETDGACELAAAVADIRALEEQLSIEKETVARLKGLRICSECGEQLAADAAFCNKCGTRQEFRAPAVPVCRSCGQPLSEGAVFCTGCGARQ